MKQQQISEAVKDFSEVTKGFSERDELREERNPLRSISRFSRWKWRKGG